MLRDVLKKNLHLSFNPSKWLTPAIIGMIIIGAVTFGILSIVQQVTHSNIRQSLFEQQKDRQIETTRSLAQHIGSDMDSISSKLESLSNVIQIQKGDLSSPQTKQIVQEYFDKINKVSFVDYILILNKTNIVTMDIRKSSDQMNFEGMNLSSSNYVQEAISQRASIFSDGYRGVDGVYRIAITYPLINKVNNDFMGIVVASMPTKDFFARYGNIYHIQSQYIAALDTKPII